MIVNLGDPLSLKKMEIKSGCKQEFIPFGFFSFRV